MKIKYLSHSGFLLTTQYHKILIDPFITGNPNAICTVNELEADFIVLTHAHGDHTGDVVSIASRCNSTVIAVNELANYMAEFGIKSHPMHIGGGANFPFGRLKFTIAHHGSSTNDGKYMGEPAGVVITTESKKIYHCGDTGLFLDMKLIGEIDKIDLMLVPIGDNFTMGVDDAVKAVEFVNPKLAVPIHYNTFPIIQADPNEFLRKVESVGKKACVMEFGQEINL